MFSISKQVLGTVGLVFTLIAVSESPNEANKTAEPSQQKIPVIHRTFEDTGSALINPMMGWVLYYYSNIPANYGSELSSTDTVDDFPGLSTVYLRLPWSYLEPEEGIFNWSIIDAPAQRWIDKGKKIALCFSASESWMRWATPEWVVKAGAKGYNFKLGRGVDPEGPFWEPDYDDPVFLEKYEQFLRAVAARYDGNPDVAFIDVASFGVWGEGHTYSSTQLWYPAKTLFRHMDMHKRVFSKTLLVANDDFIFQGESTIQYARALGMTLRDNSILVQPPPRSYFNAEQAELFWRDFPVILETTHYGEGLQNQAWNPDMLIQAIKDYHASYLSIHHFPRAFLEAERELIDRVNQILGYRIRLRSASWPATVKQGDRHAVQLILENAGVAPCYPGGYPAITLKDTAGGIMGVFVNESWNVRTLEPAGCDSGSQADLSIELAAYPQIPEGEYTLWFSIGRPNGTPVLALPLESDDGHHRYLLGEISVTRE